MGELVNAWGRDEHPSNPSFNCPEALAMSANSVSMSPNAQPGVVAFDPDIGAASFQSFGQAGTGPGQFTQVHGIEFDQDGNLLVGDDEPHTCTYARIMRFSPAGAYLGQFGTFPAGTGASHVFCVQDIERDAAGNVFVSDAGERVFAFAPDGTLVRQISSPGQLGFVIGLDNNSSCELYGVDRNNARVEVLGWRDSPTCRPVTPLASSLGSLPPDATSPRSSHRLPRP